MEKEYDELVELNKRIRKLEDSFISVHELDDDVVDVLMDSISDSNSFLEFKRLLEGLK